MFDDCDLLLVAVLAATFTLHSGCADDIAPTGDPDAAPVLPGDDARIDPASRVVTTDNGDGTFTTVVDATAADVWVGFDVASRAEAGTTGDTWDLGFQRVIIQLNGGVSGIGGVELAILPDTAFADVTAAPADGWISDVADGADTDELPDYAFTQQGGWYDYDPSTHLLSPKPTTYVVHTHGGPYIKLAIEDYYDDAGTSAFVTFRWAAVTAPASPRR